MDVNYDALMAFAVFAEHQNFTRAAEQLHISQPALHQKISRLAESLDLKLYVRNGRELALTSAGEKLAAHARYVASLTDDVLARAVNEQRGGPVSIASGPGSLLHLIGPLIPEARRGPYPLRLLTMRGREAAARVRAAEVHIAVGVFTTRNDGLECFDWFEVNQQLIVPAGHRLAERERVEAADLDGEALIVPPSGHPNRAIHERLLAAVEWHNSVEALGYDLAMAFVNRGMGITITNDFLQLPDGVVAIPIEGFPSVTFQVAVRAGTTHSGTRWMCEFLLDSRR